jgi:hypothetical protein
MPTPAKELHKELRYGNVNAHRYFDWKMQGATKLR